MQTGEMLDAYVRDVAACLPRRTRRDVAFELRALLDEELAARAETAGRKPDRAMVMALLAGFGRPTEAARRYRERAPIIDPADTHHFVIWAVGGAVALGVLAAVNAPGAAESDLFLRWLGALVIVFALMGWWRRLRPGVFGWKPKRAHDDWPRWVIALSLVMTLLFPVWMYAAPQGFTRTVFLGRVTTDGLALSAAFADSWQRAATIGALILVSAVYAAGLAIGRWVPALLWALAIAYLMLGQLLVLHATPMDGPGGPFRVFEDAEANRVAAPLFALVGAGVILSGLYGVYREWARVRPAPARSAPGGRGPARSLA